ncbi:hypothetical protein GQS40_11920|uniref:Branched-chain amino acid ABC transporter permease n=1 Tax=Leuconostoc lactis TaxID=1246 RepID=A0A6L7ADK4_LEULA|nr:hypothetical protein [Leuconostoc lactis]
MFAWTSANMVGTLGAQFIKIDSSLVHFALTAMFVYMLVMSVLVFSGGGQFLVVALLATQSSVSTILMMVFFLELRYALLGATLSRYLKHESNGFLAIFSQSMNDENL